MRPKNDEEFEQYLRQFEPLPPGPLPQTRERSARRLRALAAIAAMFLVATGLMFLQSRGSPQLIRPQLAGETAITHPAAMNKAAGKSIPDLELPDLSGAAMRLSALRGKVLLVNFWASWCVPCQTEMPWLTQFQERHQAEGFQVVAISMDEDQSQCGPFIEQHGLESLTVLLGDRHAADRFGGIFGLPTSFLIDRDGAIVSKHPGIIDRDAVEQEITQLLRRPMTNSVSAVHETIVTIEYLNHLLRDNPATLEAALSEASRRALPPLQGAKSTLRVLAKDESAK